MKAEAQTFHCFIYGVHKRQFFEIHDEDTANCDEMPRSLTGHMKWETKSLADRRVDNEVFLSPFTSQGFQKEYDCAVNCPLSPQGACF